MAVTTRQGLIDYCLRELGEPISEVNVDELQVEDRVDEALEHWYQYHSEGIEKVYLKEKVTASEIVLTTSVAENFSMAEVITGATSGATAKVARETTRGSTGTLLLVRDIQGTFVEGEVINGGDSEETGTIDSITLGTYDKRYFQLPDSVYGISRVLPFSAASSSKSLFDLQYQLRLNDLYDLTSTSIIYYKTVMSHLALLDLELNGHPQFRFNRMQGRLYLDINWQSDVVLGDYVVFETYRALDPTTWSKVWNEPWLKAYTTALFKRQWGANGKKFQGLVLPGGISVDWAGMYNEAKEEIKELEDDLLNKSAPLEFFMG
jgi:hypothetical protein